MNELVQAKMICNGFSYIIFRFSVKISNDYKNKSVIKQKLI